MDIVICGPLRAEYFILPDRKSHPKVLGGPALYAAAGAKIWTPQEVGLLSRVGDDFSDEDIRNICVQGINRDGIHFVSGKRFPASFYCYENYHPRADWDPVKYYSKNQLPFPMDLKEYSSPSLGEDSATHFSDCAIRKEDIPFSYRQARAVYLAPCHYLSQLTLTAEFRQYNTGTIILSPSERLASPVFLDLLRKLLLGVDIFFCRDEWLTSILDGKYQDPREMSVYISRMGPKIVLLQQKYTGVTMYESDSHAYRFIPFYSVEIKNPYGIGDAFCGGFLWGWKTTYDPVESSLYGCVSASLAMERIGALSMFSRSPGLEEARLMSLRKLLPKEPP
jgi:sugar/nucleoside kinase (ribokinase family)